MSDEMLYISIDLPNKKENLIDEIKNLPVIRSTKKRNDNEPLILSSLSKVKKEKKKKKKIEREKLKNELLESVDTDRDEDGVIYEDRDIDEVIDDFINDLDEIGDPIIQEQRRSYQKRKKDKSNPYKKEFAEEMTLLYDLLNEMNDLTKELDKKYKSLNNTKTRGMSKYMNDMVINMLSAKSNKLQIIKEINNLKKTIVDLKIKEEAKTNKDKAQENNIDLLASQYLKQIMTYGRNNFINEMPKVDRAIDDAIENIDLPRIDYTSDDLDTLHSLIDDRLDNEETPFRSESGNKYIEYEDRDIKICVKRCIDTGEWEFVALDNNNQQVFDYPLPNPINIGKVKFKDNFMIDGRGRMYKLIEYFSHPES